MFPPAKNVITFDEFPAHTAATNNTPVATSGASPNPVASPTATRGITKYCNPNPNPITPGVTNTCRKPCKLTRVPIANIISCNSGTTIVFNGKSPHRRNGPGIHNANPAVTSSAKLNTQLVRMVPPPSPSHDIS